MPLSFDTTQTLKTPVNIFSGVAVPTTTLTVTAGGLPDATQNPNAQHLGYTREGITITTTREQEEEFADEFKAAIISSIKTTGISIAGEGLQVLNFKLLELLTKGVGTLVTGAGFKRINFGTSALDYTGVVAIFQNPAGTSSEFGYVHLYRALNEGGLTLPISGKKLSSVPFNFKAYEVAGRAATDTLGTINVADADYV
jgi:hypothetical protein